MLVLVFASLMVGCGTVPDVNALLHTNPVDYLAPNFVGPHGAVTAREGEQIIARLEEHQEVPSDILKRQIVFEQVLSDVPLTLGNKLILLENGAQTSDLCRSADRSAAPRRAGQPDVRQLWLAQHAGRFLRSDAA